MLELMARRVVEYVLITFIIFAIASVIEGHESIRVAAGIGFLILCLALCIYPFSKTTVGVTHIFVFVSAGFVSAMNGLIYLWPDAQRLAVSFYDFAAWLIVLILAGCVLEARYLPQALPKTPPQNKS